MDRSLILETWIKDIGPCRLGEEFHGSADYAAGVGVGNVATFQAPRGGFVVYSSKGQPH